MVVHDSPHVIDALVAARPVLWCSPPQPHVADRVFPWSRFLAIVAEEAVSEPALSAGDCRDG